MIAKVIGKIHGGFSSAYHDDSLASRLGRHLAEVVEGSSVQSGADDDSVEVLCFSFHGQFPTGLTLLDGLHFGVQSDVRSK